MYTFLVLLAGFFTTAMAGLNGMLSDYLSLFGMSFIVHFSGGLLLLLYMLLFVKQPITLTGMPWYLYSAGFFGIFLVTLTGYCVQVLGASVTTCLSVTGQLFMSAIVDHFGLFGVEKVPFNPKRTAPILLILIGIVVINI